MNNKVHALAELTEIRPGRSLAIHVSPSISTTKGIVLFIHGVGEVGWIWHKQCTYFNKLGYRTVTFDLVGHGNSPLVVESGLCCRKSTQKTHIYMYASSNSCNICLQCPLNESINSACHFDAHFEDVQAIFDQFVTSFYPNDETSATYKTVVVGHSYGTSLAVRLAEARNNLVDRVVLISGGAPTPLEQEANFLALPSACLACFMPCIRTAFRNYVFGKKKSSDAPGLSQTTPVVDKGDQRRAFAFNAYTLRGTIVGQDWPQGDHTFYAKLRMPVLLIVGCRDQLISMQEDEETLFCLYAGRLRCLEEAGHMSMLEDADRVNAFIHDHIDSPPIPAVSRRVAPRQPLLTRLPITQQPPIQPSDSVVSPTAATQFEGDETQSQLSGDASPRVEEVEQAPSIPSVPNILTPRLHFKSASIRYLKRNHNDQKKG